MPNETQSEDYYKNIANANPWLNNIVSTDTLSGNQTVLTVPEKPQTDYPIITAPPIQSEDPMKQILEEYALGTKSNAPSSTEGQDIYSGLENQANIAGLQTNVNTANSFIKSEQANLSAINAELTKIVNEATQAQLQNEQNASGKDITTSFLSRQGQEISRQTAIRALPLQSLALVSQAKIQSFQGNAEAAQTLLTQAQDRVDKLFSLRVQDLQNSRDYNQKLIDTVYDFATNREKRLLDDKKIKNEQEFTLQRDAIQNQYDIDKINLQNSLKVQTAQNDSTPQIISDTVNQIMSNPEANTPILTRAVLSELVGNKAISSGTRAKIAPAVEVLNAVEELAGLNQEGKFTGSGGIFGLAPLGQWFKGIFNAQDTEYVNNRQALEAINLKAQQWASGAALTEAQTKQVQKFTPNVYDSDKQMRTKINGLYNFMLNQAEANLLTEGINVQFPSVNLFETYDLMKKASPEQRKELEKLLNQQ